MTDDEYKLEAERMALLEEEAKREEHERKMQEAQSLKEEIENEIEEIRKNLFDDEFAQVKKHRDLLNAII